MKRFITLIALLLCFLISCSSYGARVLHYKMNDNSATSTVVDSIGAYNGTYKDAEGEINTDDGTAMGKINECLDFDGDEYIDVGNTLQAVFRDDFSIALWFKADDGQHQRGSNHHTSLSGRLLNFNCQSYVQMRIPRLRDRMWDSRLPKDFAIIKPLTRCPG